VLTKSKGLGIDRQRGSGAAERVDDGFGGQPAWPGEEVCYWHMARHPLHYAEADRQSVVGRCVAECPNLSRATLESHSQPLLFRHTLALRYVDEVGR
jgi:hypothetical protein